MQDKSKYINLYITHIIIIFKIFVPAMSLYDYFVLTVPRQKL